MTKRTKNEVASDLVSWLAEGTPYSIESDMVKRIEKKFNGLSKDILLNIELLILSKKEK